MIKTIITINNTISDLLAKKSIKIDGINPNEIFLIKERKFQSELEKLILKKNIIEVPVNSNFFDKLIFLFKLPIVLIKFRKLLLSKNLKNVFIVNNVSLFGASIILFKRDRNLDYTITSLVEGLMNFEEEKIRRSSNFVTQSKRIISLIFFLPWRKIEGHPSGSYNNEITRVISFSSEGLFAPKNKIKIIPINKVKKKIEFDKNSLFIIHSPLNNIFGKENYIILCNLFIDWLQKQEYERLYFKFHPNHKDIYLYQSLSKKNLKLFNHKIEDISHPIPSKNVVSFFSTSLFTLKSMYPELNIFSFGLNFYQAKTNQKTPHNLIKLYKSVGIKFIDTKKDEE